ncbi:hypothetical protein JYU34_010052 [Plutella xylostella]|uniref:Uncharacterized protein n=1 Tax=Plutella xylostella TaxID=51655 RepID=A0ABQ7QHK2_PLUXY|nr:hypothetical protein JYU34_010052 [Plutella xylostella]
MVVPEGIVPGNPLMDNGKTPSCQVQLVVVKEGVHYMVGAGFRVENHLITPAHNLQCGMDAYLRNGDKLVRLEGEGLSLAADVVAYPISERDWSQLGVTRAKLAPLNKVANVCVTSGKYSISGLKGHRDMIGRCVYFG